MVNRQALMEEFFELGVDLRSFADEYRTVMAPIQARRKEIESILAGDPCGDADCSTCYAQPRVGGGRTLN